MGATSFNWRDNLSPNLEKLHKRCDAAVLMYAITKAQQLEYYMKINRKWTDRTGAAKARLKGTASIPKEHQVRITLAHGVNYGIWLELAHEMNYAIIRPTILMQSAGVMRGFDTLMAQILQKLG